MSRWTHVDRTARNKKGRFHEVDPHYEGRAVPVDGRMVYWTCHAKGCDREIRLDGAAVPIVTPVRRARPAPEATMSAQP